MAILPPEIQDEWLEKIRAALPDFDVRIFRDSKEASDFISDADCACGYVPPDLFLRARKLRWIQCYAANPDPSFWHEPLVNSKVVVTNFRGIYNEHVSAHAMSLVLAFSRDLHTYSRQQTEHLWSRVRKPSVYLPEATAVIVGMGGIGSETSRLCAAFGIKVLGVDPRADREGVFPPEKLDELLPRADFVILTVPETPATRGMIDLRRLRLMKKSAYLINVGRGVLVVTRDLVDALKRDMIAGAGLDVFEEEPLPKESDLWDDPRVIITPHVAALTDYEHVPERRTRILVENCRRFQRGETLINVVDKKRWY